MRRPLQALLIAALGAAAFAGCGDPTAEGVRAWEAGRYEEACAAFGAAADRLGDDAPAALHADRALAAWRTGRTAEAEAAARLAGAGDDLEAAALGDEVLGLVQYARAEAGAEAAMADAADPRALEMIIGRAEEAALVWRRAAASDGDRPTARRNAERALGLLDRLRRLRSRRDAGSDPGDPPPPAPGPGPEPSAERPPGPAPAPLPAAAAGSGAAADLPEAVAADLAPDAVMGLLGRLERLEAARRKAREQERRDRSGGVERDW